MDKRKAFGFRDWFIKNAIYNMLIEDKDYFGINPPVRNSGDLANSETITIIGPKGEITKKNICIIIYITESLFLQQKLAH